MKVQHGPVELRDDEGKLLGTAPAGEMEIETPFEQWIECPECHGTGDDENGVDDPDYGIPKCPTCQGVGEVDPRSVMASKNTGK